MKKKRDPEPPASHFSKRAGRYDSSARWVRDKALLSKIKREAGALKGRTLLDLAVGTGAIAGTFKGKAGLVVGVDICEAMAAKAAGRADLLVRARAEKLPFPDGSFDICVCRQGLQFMRLDRALSEVRRVLRPGGRAVFCHLTSYGRADDGRSFLVQRLRNPARRNFFSPGDLAREAKKYFSRVTTAEHLTRESVGNWISNGAVPPRVRRRIMRIYRNAPPAFRKTHRLEFRNGDVFDSMRMEIVTGIL
ncbi:MAG: class I SAM-dependent methyltransferase [Elusimicrobiales bacterium]